MTASEEPARASSSGLISSILGQAQTADDGALAALRTLPRRAAPDPDYTDPIGAGQRVRDRVELLLELAQHGRNDQQVSQARPAQVQARLLTQAAELLAQLGDSERAHATYVLALAKDPRQRLAAQQLYRDYVRRGDLENADKLLETLYQLSSDARERCLALCARAELARRGQRSEKVVELLELARREQPGSLLAALLLAQRLFQTGQHSAYATVLREASEHADVAQTRALLLLEAGRAQERAGEREQALASYTKAHSQDSSLPGALLGAARMQLAAGDRAAAAATLGQLAALEKHLELSAEWARQRGLQLLEGLDDAAQAAQVLQGQRSASGLRVLTRAAQAAGDHAEETRAREAWAQASGGVLRGVIRAEQTRARRRAQPDLSLLPTAAHAAHLRGRGADELLRRAAALSDDPQSLRDEHAVLREVAPDDPSFLDADILAFDTAAQLSELPLLRAAVRRDAERWPDRLRAGPLMAALDLDGIDHTKPEHRELWEALGRLTQGQPVVSRYMAARAQSIEHGAQLWLAEALSASDGHAAFAATTAGHYLEMAGLDATEAYVDALDAQRGYLPAAFGMEIRARATAELSALERIHREIADTSRSHEEQSARYVRLGLLNADSDLSSAAHWLGLAAENSASYGSDTILDELSIRLAMDRSPAHQAELLESAAERQRSAAYARAMRLQAAEAHESAGQWDDALRLYRAQLADNPEDIFADCALISCLRRRGRPALLAAELERRVLHCDEPAARAVMLEEWAHAEHAQGDVRKAHVLWQRAVSEQGLGVTVSSLRALERYAMQSGDSTLLRQYSQQLSEALEERVSSAAELRVCIRMCRRLGIDLYTPLMAAEGRVRESWYAHELEAFAMRADDRLRLYEAMSMQSDLARERVPQERIERAAYALRAAEVLEQTAPARAARELADALASTREHPLATEQLARLYKAAGDTLAAAHTFTRAARSSASPQRAVALHYTAAVLFQDELDEPEHALENLQRAGKLDLLFADTFTRLLLLLQREGRKSDIIELLDERVKLPLEPQLGAQLHVERYQLLAERGDMPGAEKALEAALSFDPSSSQVLFALGELQQRNGAHRQAAETWTKLINSLDEASDRKALADVHFSLGVLHRDRLSDVAAAEQTFTRGLTLMPEHVDTLTGLTQLYKSQGRFEEALRPLSTLVEVAPAGVDREHLIAQQAELREKLGDHSAAVETLEAAERSTPTSLILVRAHAELLARTGAQETREAVLLRGCNALRAAIEANPREVHLWRGLHELLLARDTRDAAALVAHAAHVLGIAHPDLPNTLLHGLGARALAPAVLASIAPPGALLALSELLRELGPALEPHLPFEHVRQPMLASLVREYQPAITAQLGLGELQISRCEENLCLPLSAAPLQLCVGSSWFDKASDAERSFGLLRALALAKLDLSLLARAEPERFGLVLNALWSVVDRTHMVAVLDSAEQNRVAGMLAENIDGSQRARTKQLVDAVVEHEDVQPRRLHSAAFEYGARVALCVTGDLWSGLSCLLGLRSKSSATPQVFNAREKLELCSKEPTLRRLLAFAISESYAQVRELANQQASQEPR